ncbi:MAG: hypothetical protein EZS28_034208 [Streblomastix strix]|uniref:Uncharacterized protein n=1 Tax=Streblomastix strix TaxID=222440 RepID=A0A5J4UKJ7_9EUKA|nr:MAG: hypothetical protein EZS28_034208 [Streblomastix strix]
MNVATLDVPSAQNFYYRAKFIAEERDMEYNTNQDDNIKETEEENNQQQNQNATQGRDSMQSLLKRLVRESSSVKLAKGEEKKVASINVTAQWASDAKKEANQAVSAVKDAIAHAQSSEQQNIILRQQMSELLRLLLRKRDVEINEKEQVDNIGNDGDQKKQESDVKFELESDKMDDEYKDISNDISQDDNESETSEDEILKTFLKELEKDNEKQIEKQQKLDKMKEKIENSDLGNEIHKSYKNQDSTQNQKDALVLQDQIAPNLAELLGDKTGLKTDELAKALGLRTKIVNNHYEVRHIHIHAHSSPKKPKQPKNQ